MAGNGLELELAYGLRTTQPTPAEAIRTKPMVGQAPALGYASVAEACSLIAQSVRYDGLTVMITGIGEYWWQAADFSDAGLEAKQTASGGVAGISAYQLEQAVYLASPALAALPAASLVWLHPDRTTTAVTLDPGTTQPNLLVTTNRPLDGAVLAYLDAQGMPVPVPTDQPGPYLEVTLADTVSMLSADPPVVRWALYAISGTWNGSATASTVYVPGLTDKRWASLGWVLVSGEPQAVVVDVGGQTWRDLLTPAQLARLAPVFVNTSRGEFLGFPSLTAVAVASAAGTLDLDSAVIILNDFQDFTAATATELLNWQYFLRGNGQLLAAAGTGPAQPLGARRISDTSLSNISLDTCEVFNGHVGDTSIPAGSTVTATDTYWSYSGVISGTLILGPGTITDGVPILSGAGQVIDQRGGAPAGATIATGFYTAPATGAQTIDSSNAKDANGNPVSLVNATWFGDVRVTLSSAGGEAKPLAYGSGYTYGPGTLSLPAQPAAADSVQAGAVVSFSYAMSGVAGPAPSYTAGPGIAISASSVISATGDIDYVNPVQYTADTTLDATAFGKSIVLGGSGGTLTLPNPAMGNGQRIGLRIGQNCTGLWHLMGQDIDGQPDRYLHHGESRELLSNGQGYRKLTAVPIPLMAKIQGDGTGNYTVNSNLSNIPLPAMVRATLPQMAPGDGSLKAVRPGNYLVLAKTADGFSQPVTELDFFVAVQGQYNNSRSELDVLSSPGFGSSLYYLRPSVTAIIPFALNEVASLVKYSATVPFFTENRAANPAYITSLEFIEQNPW